MTRRPPGVRVVMGAFAVAAMSGCAEAPAPTETPLVEMERPAADAGGSPAVPATDQSIAEIRTEPHASERMGAIEVRGDTTDWFDVLQNGASVLGSAPLVLNNSAELPPGTYQVAVNRTERTVALEVGTKVVLQTGTLVVAGTDANFYVPFQGDERMVSANPRTLNTPMAMFPGTYRVELNHGVRGMVVLTGDARVMAGTETVLQE